MDGENNSMNNWKSILADVDDDYLIGLANKGIVKRAYKDKEEGNVTVLKIEEEAKVKVGEETVLVRFPLGESKCSCPSRSICRHVVLAILVLKESITENMEGEKSKPAETNNTKAENSEQAETALKEADYSEQKTAAWKDSDRSQPEEAAVKVAEKETDLKNKREAEKKAIGGMGEKLLEEICNYPVNTLKKALGARHFQNFIGQVKAGVRPEINYSSVITVRLMEQGVTVKLLLPLEYSSCTCHKKDLCAHKAAAILWCQLDAKAITEETLIGEAAESQDYNMEQIKEAAGQMKKFLEELLGTGLSRTSPDVLDYLERLAIISHNANLPNFEGYFRALFDSYGKYLRRAASFQTKKLMGQITRLYRRVELLIKAENRIETARQAGEFKAEYILVGNLDLIGITIEYFKSQTGYEGETVYFLEEHTKEWYTYTVARPVFYEKGKRGKPEKGPAPWGLLISLEDLAGKRIHLSGAKCDERKRLSSSQETKGEVTGERRLTWKDLEGWYYQDFKELFLEQIGKETKEWLREQKDIKDSVKLVVLQPDFIEKAEFSETGQQLSMVIYDKAGREVVIEVTYSKKEEWGIRYLERIRENRIPYFLGKIYLRDGRIRMYPVAVMERREIRDEWL